MLLHIFFISNLVANAPGLKFAKKLSNLLRATLRVLIGFLIANAERGQNAEYSVPRIYRDLEFVYRIRLLAEST